MPLDYSTFRFRAVVDWIEIEIQTIKATNFATIRRHCRLPYAKPLDAGSGGAATAFRIRLQDPESHHSVVRRLQEIAEFFPFAVQPSVTAIEVSFDAYSRGSNSDGLAELAARFFKFQTHPVSGNRRISGRWKGDVEGLVGFDRIRRLIAQGRVIAIGNKTDQRSQRVYFKTTDQGGKISLPVDDHRARIEVTLQGEALPARSLDDWASFRFESLSDFFRFRMLKEGLGPLLSLIAERVEQIGERKARPRAKKDKTGYSGERLYDITTRADAVLNDRAKGALRELSRRWRAGRMQVACGNSGEIVCDNPLHIRICGDTSNNYVKAT